MPMIRSSSYVIKGIPIALDVANVGFKIFVNTLGMAENQKGRAVYMYIPGGGQEELSDVSPLPLEKQL